MLRHDNAIVRESPAFRSALEDGGETGFDDQYRRTVTQFDTGDPWYSWLTSSLYLGEGRLVGDHRDRVAHPPARLTER